MATKEMRPGQKSWNDQEHRQRRRARSRKVGSFALVAVILLAAGAFALSQLRKNDATPQSHSTSTPHGVDAGRPTHPAIVALDGTVTQVRGLPLDARSLSLSPDATEIVFVADNNGSPQIATIGLDGSGLRFVTHVTSVSIARGTLHGPFTPVWSPDGSRIAFSNGHIYVMNPDGSGLTPLTSGPGVDQWPSWSPDGSTIAYSNGGTSRTGTSKLNDNATSRVSEIWTVPATGGTPTRLTSGGGNDMPAYSPDGSRIAFDNGGGIFLMDADGQNPRLVKGLPTAAFSPRWSPDGGSLAYLFFSGSYSPDGVPLQRVGIVHLSTGSIERIPGLVEGVEPNTVQWLPSGDALLENRYVGTTG